MFRTLLTPLSARFALSPSSPLPEEHTQQDDFAPEDFARDVLIDLMRGFVDKLKFAETMQAKSDALTEIHKVMLEDAQTKDVFREMDGFLIVMSVLSTMQAITGNDPQSKVDVLEAVRLTFVVLSEALYQHAANTAYFKRSVGYESLSQAVVGLVSDRSTVRPTLGFLVSLALHRFAMSGLFEFAPDVDYSQLDQRIRDFEPAFGTIQIPEALIVLFNFVTPASHDDAVLRYSILKLFERLSFHDHRSQCVLSSLNLAEPLFKQYCVWKDDGSVVKQERQLIQKLLRRLVEVGTSTAEARLMFQQVIRADQTLDGDVLETLRSGMKVRWPEHFSLEPMSALQMSFDEMKGLPPSGFTFMIWLWVERFPKDTAYPIFSCHLNGYTLVSLKLCPNGHLELHSAAARDPTPLKASVPRTRWTHVTFVHHPHRSANPTIRIFTDGAVTDALNWAYPKAEANRHSGLFVIGDSSSDVPLSWCVASACLVASPLADSLPRFIHHLGPRYTAHFQTAELAKFLTYEASTALHIYMDGAAQQSVARADVTQLQAAIKNGIGINQASVVFALTPSHTKAGLQIVEGDVFVMNHGSLDSAMWRIGGAAVALKLVQLASTAHEVSRALGIISDGLRNSWENSEDMERLRGYDVLAALLRSKSHLINMTGFETLFEFLGLNFRSPDQSTIVNTVAYRAIALDFQLWSSTKEDIQRLHLAHFRTLLQTSKYKRFNTRQRIAKMTVVRKLLFVLQTSLYQFEVLPALIEAIKVVAQAHFSADDAIKPIVSYLAANLHEAVSDVPSPRSVISRIDYHSAQIKAEHIFSMLVSILGSPPAFAKFSSTLPVARICLLLLGERPSPATAAQVLHLIGISLNASMTFSRKFELVSGWNVLKVVIPHVWDRVVQMAAFDVLFGRSDERTDRSFVVTCSHILPAIFASLKLVLEKVGSAAVSGANEAHDVNDTQDTAEGLLEELMESHSASPTFRQAFKSQATTQAFIDAYRSFVVSISMAANLSLGIIRILEKLSHVGLSIALDNAVSSAQKQEIMDILQSAETALNPLPSQETAIDAAALLGAKSRRRRIASVRLSVQLGETTVKRSIARINEWRKTVIATERKRLRKTVLDLREHHRQISSLTDWATRLIIERGLWADVIQDRRWQLDETEGPYRVRKKLEPAYEEPVSSTVEAQSHAGEWQMAESDGQSVLHLEVPWSGSMDAGEENQLQEEIVDDKHRRVRHELEPGDVIEAASTVARISGIDSFPGLLIFGKTHLYMLDGLVQNEDEEVIDAHEAPKKLFFVPGSIVELNGPQRAQRWNLEQVVSYSDRSFLFRDVALEIYFKDSRSLLVVFLHKRQRQEVTDRLSPIVNRLLYEAPPPSPAMLKSPLLSPMMGRLSGKLSASLSAKVLTGLRLDELSTAQRKWQTREISNFTYLSILNQISGRTPSDATQYPVFPWVISDYTSATLNLRSTDTYRDLTRPMGALTPVREEAARARYAALQSVGEKPFHYGTHFSSSMIVCHFLIRLEPFSHMFKTLQGGDWDLPDRLFSDVRRAYESASQDVRGDVRELIPEFYALPEFLENLARIDFGVQQNTGERIDDVKLPPWAKQDPLLFVVLNRAALESDHVSEHLPQWIDLIWGCKQRDPDSENVYHPLSYEGSIDLDAITDDLEREATVGIIHNFGQTPRKLFHSPHPERMMHGNSSLSIGTLYGVAEDYHLLSQSAKVAKDLGPGRFVRELIYDHIGQRIIPCSSGMLCVPSHPHEQIQWDHRGGAVGDLKILVDQRIVQVVEATACSCAAFADANTLITGSNDHAVRLWKLQRGSGHLHRQAPLSATLTHIMRSHTEEVLCVTASRAWSIVVSGSKDGSAVFWDLNRGTYVRSIWHGPGDDTDVFLAAVNESTGYVATCSRQRLCLHTVNGRLIASLDLLSSAMHDSYPAITSVAFLERDYARVGVLATGTPDGTIALRTWNADKTPENEKAQWEFVTLKTLKVKGPDGQVQPKGYNPCVTVLKFVGECLYHGEDTGRVFSWDLPD